MKEYRYAIEGLRGDKVGLVNRREIPGWLGIEFELRISLIERLEYIADLLERIAEGHKR